MTAYATDTHALIWYLEAHPRLGGAARAVLEDADDGRARIYISAISLVEMVLLAERGKVPSRVLPSTLSRIDASGSTFVLVPVEKSVVAASSKYRG